ncbi:MULTISPECIES: ABC-three component system middle component 1 [unclassified Neptuniibacter]|uniref:ABC-three component system middle component 1 n=1 Tax=unclassified Neptuniibacter TaxID=2630693 RepID=UPI002600F63E|nr:MULTISPECIES: ABC-three component system middle component 1 [unclassified Neptuniibacter]|tara:strand:+ start:12545 stop:13204 length:660 start_codon:yes stop_codon:yes gene_type:complete
MLSQIINEALSANGFNLVSDSEPTSYYIHEDGESIRFAILHHMDDLPTPEELNSIATENAPSLFIEHPAFKKNSDLICILKFETLSGFKGLEDQIFSIEENPYHYKKHVLYYSESEEEVIKNSCYTDIIQAVQNKQLFDEYKDDPLAPSIYSIAAKIFIKLPFIKLPFNRQDLVPLSNRIQEAISEHELNYEYTEIQENSDTDKLITDLIAHELENIPN